MNNNFIFHARLSARQVMLETLIALVPGIAVLTWFFGAAVISQILLAAVTALICEFVISVVRNKDFSATALDGSGLLTATLLAISLPPALPWWMIVNGTVFAIIVVKHIYGGLGFNIFNPAMMAYVMLIISFPVEMTSWAALSKLASLPLVEQLTIAFGGGITDSFTGATPLTDIKDTIKSGLTTEQYMTSHATGFFAMKNWENINIAFLLGGLYLIARGIINYRVPLFLLLFFGLLATVYNFFDPSYYPSPLFHLFAGGSMLGAFFIATDPVTAPVARTGLIIFAAGVGTLEFIIRTFGGYPDGIAFAVVIMNMFVPLINHLTRPHVG